MTGLGDFHGQSVCIDLPVEDAGSLFSSKGRLDISSKPIIAVKGNAPAAAGTADLWRDGAVGESDVDEVVHLRRCNVWRKFLAVRM